MTDDYFIKTEDFKTYSVFSPIAICTKCNRETDVFMSVNIKKILILKTN